MPNGRLVGAIAALAKAVGTAVLELIKAIGGGDNKLREEFVKKFLTEASREYPNYNIALIHTRHSVSGEYVHQHHELPISLGRTIGYEIYFAVKGRPFTLTNHGDGGWINWGYIGNFKRNGNTITAT